MHWVRLTEDLKFEKDLKSSVIDWRPVQGVPCPFTLQQLQKDPDPKLDKLKKMDDRSLDG